MMMTLRSIWLFILCILSHAVIAASVNEFSSFEYQLKELYARARSHTIRQQDAQSCTVTPNGLKLLNTLLDDFKRYITSNVDHAGNLYEHSLWTGHALANWWTTRKFWIENIDQKDKNLTILAGLLHDVGKAGDHKFTYFTKSNHPKTGFNYVTGKSIYRLVSNKQYDFKKLRKLFSISHNDWALLAVSIAMHWEFGNTMARRGTKAAVNYYISKLREYARLARYNQGQINLRLLNICMAVSAADARATGIVSLVGAPNGFQFAPIRSLNRPGGKFYDAFQYESYGNKIRNKLYGRVDVIEELE